MSLVLIYCLRCLLYVQQRCQIGSEYLRQEWVGEVKARYTHLGAINHRLDDISTGDSIVESSEDGQEGSCVYSAVSIQQWSST